MYGLVNKAIEDLLRRDHGTDVWDRIRRRAGVEDTVFIGMRAYCDRVTYDLVAAASAELGVDPATLLEAFGEYWILYTAEEGYGELLAMGGKSLCEFLLHLDELHTRVALTFRDLRPPSFRCTDVEEGSLRLHYESERPGLAPMVTGLLRGLGRMFNTEIDIERVARREDGADHDEFLVKYRANP
jgi:hypothetical protein